MAQTVRHVRESVPVLGQANVEARAVVGDREQQPARLLPDPHGDVRLRGVLACVLQGFETAEVHGRFDVTGVAADPLGQQLNVEGTPVDHGTQRPAEAAVDKQRRVDPMGQLAQLLDGVLNG